MSDQASAPKLVEEVMTIASTPCDSAKLREGAPCCSRNVRLLLVTGLLLVDAVAVCPDVVVSFGFCSVRADLNFLDLLQICEFFHCLAVVSVLIFCFYQCSTGVKTRKQVVGIYQQVIHRRILNGFIMEIQMLIHLAMQALTTAQFVIIILLLLLQTTLLR